MLLFYFLIALAGIKEINSKRDNLKVLQKTRNDFESNLIQQVLNELPGYDLINLLQDKSQKGNERSLSFINRNTIGLLSRKLITKTSNQASDFPTLVAKNISQKCHDDSQAYYDANLLLVNWANQMFESTAKLPEGIYGGGNVHSNGLYDECINVQAEWTNTSFQGQYCTVYFETALVMPEELANETSHTTENLMQRSNWLSVFEALMLQYNGPTLKQPKVRETDALSKYLPSTDFCIPSSCSWEDFQSSVAQIVGSRTTGNTTVDGKFYYTSVVTITDERHCYTKEKINTAPNFDGAEIAMLVALSVLGFIILLATAHELWLTYKNTSFQPTKDGFCLTALNCFSVPTNIRKLVSTKAAVIDNLGCLNGIRVLSTAWIVLYHTYLFACLGFHFPVYNRFMFQEEAMTWQLFGVMNGTVAVDTFFFMSGLLVAFSLLRELDRNKGRFNIALFYLHRYLSIYAFILGFIATLLSYLGSGPYWQSMYEWNLACRWNWWNNLLYVNNYVFTYPMECMGQTWYLACDMQMFILSPLFIYPLWKWWKVGVTWALFAILASIGGMIAMWIVRDYPAMFFLTRDFPPTGFYRAYYVQIWTRCPPYILGILIGWLLHRTKKTQIKLNKFVVAIGWALAIAILLAVSYGMVPYLDLAQVPVINEAVNVSYGTLHRFAWSVSLAWIVFACIHGYGGFVNQFLSWKAFIPLSRLSYVVYLTHENYIRTWHSFTRKPYYYTSLHHTQHYFGTVLMVCLISFAVCLTIEVPFLNLEKVLFPTRTKKPQQQLPNSQKDLRNYHNKV